MGDGLLEGEAERLLELLLERKLIRVWPADSQDGWELHSRIWSPFYIDLRGLTGLDNAKEVLAQVGTAFASVIRTRAPQVTRLVGVATGGIPVTVATTMVSGIPSCYTRRFDSSNNGRASGGDGKNWGENRFLEGEIRHGDKLLLVDDLITDGSSKLQALDAITSEAERCGISVECRDVAVILDRGQGGAERLKGLGVRLHALVDLKTTGLSWLEGRMKPGEVNMIRTYLENPLKFANKEERGQLRVLLD